MLPAFQCITAYFPFIGSVHATVKLAFTVQKKHNKICTLTTCCVTKCVNCGHCCREPTRAKLCTQNCPLRVKMGDLIYHTTYVVEILGWPTDKFLFKTRKHYYYSTIALKRFHKTFSSFVSMAVAQFSGMILFVNNNKALIVLRIFKTHKESTAFSPIFPFFFPWMCVMRWHISKIKSDCFHCNVCFAYDKFIDARCQITNAWGELLSEIEVYLHTNHL